MFVKIENFWLNTEQIVSLEPHGKSFRVNLSNGAFLALNIQDYLVLIKAMKIKSPLKAVKKKVMNKIPTYKEFEARFPKDLEAIITEANPSPAVSDKAKPKRVAVKGTEVKKQIGKQGEGASGGKPKTTLSKIAKPVPKKK